MGKKSDIQYSFEEMKMGDYIRGLVSVVIPTYKRADKLFRAIDSVLSQSYSNLELLLVNDNNPDDEFTVELKKGIQKYIDDSRFHYIEQPMHINGAVARNVGIRNGKGEYIAFLDDDDWWEKDKIEVQVRELSQLSNEWGGVSCRIRRYKGDKLIEEQPMYKDGYVYKDVLMLLSDFETGSLLLRHDCLDDTGYFDESLLRHQDLQLLVCFSFKYKLKQIDAFLHCRDVGDTTNRPNVDKIISAKKAFFQSIQPIFVSLSNCEKRQVRLLHKAEIGYVRIKNKDYFRGAVDLLALITSPKAFCCEIRKINQKLKSKR